MIGETKKCNKINQLEITINMNESDLKDKI